MAEAALPGSLQAGRQAGRQGGTAKSAHSGARHRLCFPAIEIPIPREQNRNRKFTEGQTTARHQALLALATGELKIWRCAARQDKISKGWCSQAALSADQHSISPGLFTQGICPFGVRNMESVAVAR